MPLPDARFILNSKGGGFVLSITAQKKILVRGGGFVLQNTAPNARLVLNSKRGGFVL